MAAGQPRASSSGPGAPSTTSPSPSASATRTWPFRGRAVRFCGISDIEEPYQKWRDYKLKLTGQKWDYDFRRLFYTWTDDITSGKFQPWVEIASRDKTCGWIDPGDLYLAPDGSVHILWNERAIDERLRKEFFPARNSLTGSSTRSSGRARLSAGRRWSGRGGRRGEVPGRGRFHVTPDGRLLVFYYVQGRDAAGKAVSENRIMELRPDGTSGPEIRIPLILRGNELCGLSSFLRGHFSVSPAFCAT